MKRIFSLVLCVILININAVASETEEFVNYGYIPYEREEWQPNAEVQTFSGFSLMGSEILPERYDSRDKNYIPPVKNQGHDGTCWTFAATSALESYLLKFRGEKDTDGNVIDNSEFNFSENHIRYMMSNHFNNPLGFCAGISDGGNAQMISSYFLGDYGPVLEEDDPYYTDDIHKHRDYSETKDIPKSDYRVDSVAFIPQYRYIGVNDAKQTLIDETKKLVMEYGSAVCSVTYHSNFLNTDKTALYCGDNYGVNHQVLIVGWDDTYSKDNFKATPSTDGAFIIKNSHGADVNDNGYFYLSYCDVNVFFDVMAITSVSQRDKKELIYNLDPFGKVEAIYYGTSAANPVSYGNVFTKKTKNERLAGVSLYTYAGVTYDIYLINSELIDCVTPHGNYLEFENYSPQLVYEGLVSQNNEYQTVRFNSIEITGDKFAVMVTANDNDIIYFPIEANVGLGENGQDGSFIEGVTMEKKQSFYIHDGYYPGVFTDAYNEDGEGNFCIKAITETDDPYVEFELANITDGNGAVVNDFENAEEVHIVPAMNYVNLEDKQILCIGYKGNKMMVADFKDVGNINKFVFTDIPDDFGKYTFYMYVWGLNGLEPIGSGIKVGTN